LTKPCGLIDCGEQATDRVQAANITYRCMVNVCDQHAEATVLWTAAGFQLEETAADVIRRLEQERVEAARAFHDRQKQRRLTRAKQTAT